MITYSVSATVTRATSFDRTEFRKMAMNSGDSHREFSASVDLTVTPLPNFPILINTANIAHIRFLGIQVTGGTALIRLTQTSQIYSNNNIDLPLEGSMLLSGCDLSQIVVLGTPSGQCFIEFFGMGE